jgi:hypothetical protein
LPQPFVDAASQETGVDGTERQAGSGGRAAHGGDRRHRFPGRTKQVFVRLSNDEYDDIAAAAARVDLTPTGYVAEAALAAAGATTPVDGQDGSGITRSELAQVQRELFAARTALARVGANLNQAVAALNAAGRPPGSLGDAVEQSQRVLDRLDAVIATIDGRLR